jgi:hypothetical protein
VITYVYFGTNHLDKAIAFYTAALAPLYMQRCLTGDAEWDRLAAGWGVYEEGGLRELAFWVGIPLTPSRLPLAMAAWSRSARALGMLSTNSTQLRWPTAVPATVPPDFGPITQPTFMPPTCATPTATRWRLCVAALWRDLSQRNRRGAHDFQGMQSRGHCFRQQRDNPTGPIIHTIRYLT